MYTVAARRDFIAAYYPGSANSGRKKHLCYLHNIGYLSSNLEDWKNLVRAPKFVCKSCSRAAESGESLCDPDTL